MRYFYEKIKHTSFGKKYLVDSTFIHFLKRIKRFMGRVKRKLLSIMPQKQCFDNILTVFGEYLVDNPEELAECEEMIDVIVPIYNGYDYLVKLFEDLPKTDMKCRFILVDDKSPDERVRILEQEFVKKHENSILLENEKNYGFVRTVNRGLSISEHHVALVNTDTELPEKWLERLMRPVLHEEKVASATPYTNSGTLYSFPDFCYNNPIYRGMGVDALDECFRKVKPRYVELPTGVGFCMGMSKYALRDVGILDEVFGRGFAEENDWCQRAVKKGYRNVQVENLFVYHKHGGTFRSEEKEKLIEQHMGIIGERYPSYDYQIGAFIRKDPNKKVRQLVQMIADTRGVKSVLYFDHSLGGGATGYLNIKKEEYLTNPCCVSIVRYCINGNNYRFIFENDREDLKLEFEFQKFTDILEIGRWLHFDEIYINELVTYPKLWDVHSCILELRKQQGSKLIMLLHDFFAICPTINLLNTAREYCGMPEESICEKCYLQRGFDVQYGCNSRKEWVNHWKEFLLQCTEVRAFSEDTFQRVQKAFGEGLPLTLVEHQVEYAFPIHKECKTTDSLNIGLLGVLAIHKGSDFIKELLLEVEKQKLNVKIKLIGKTDKVNFTGFSGFEETGAYEVSQLPRLIYENDIDIFLISSIWPETFSYTAEEVIKMGLPIAAFDLGAPAERIKRYEKGLLLEERDAAKVLNQICSFATEQLRVQAGRVNYKKIVYVAEYISFSSRYRIEHMQEELLYLGVPGEIWETRTLPKKIDWNEIGAVVIYRCRYMEPLKSLMTEVKEHRIPIFYDIDDYIFNFEDIKDLPFVGDEDHRNFDVYCGKIRRCMEQCDAITVSTEQLKLAVEKSFGHKPVYVNRNVASAQMLILSALARRGKKIHTDRLVLGYFSGSNTHNRDFEVIANVLLEFMQKHEEVCLKIVGCLELPEGFQKMERRVITEGFLDWKKLPEAIGSVDINLMPLEDSFFHSCKSENKWMEAALVQVPTIGSWNEEIANATIPGENILLCRTKEDWMDNLDLLLQREDLRIEMAQKAFDYVMEHKTTLKKNEGLFKFIMEKL